MCPKGKWHLGFAQPRYTPERRGFDSAFGYYTGNAEYFNHTSPCWGCGNYTAIDLHSANATHWVGLTGASNYYSSELFSAEAVRVIEAHSQVSAHSQPSAASLPPASSPAPPPLFLYLAYQAVHGASSCYSSGLPPSCEHPDDDELQVPSRYERAQAHIGHRNRRLYAGMVGALDEGVNNITAALARSGMLDEALLLFTSDNGAPFKHIGGATMSNWPLRGGKAELWEGGVRGACFLAGGALPLAARGVRSSALLHASDLFPTLLAFARVPLPSGLGARLYGIDATRLLLDPLGLTDDYQLRSELLHNADHVTGRAALRDHDYKLVKDEPPSAWGPNPRELPPLPALLTPANASSSSSNAATTAAAAAAAAVILGIVAEGPDTSWWARGVHHGGPGTPPPSSSTPKYQLFNIAKDPQERQDLAALPEHAEQLSAMIRRLEELEGTICVPHRGLLPDAVAQPKPISDLSVCTPSVVGPILCDQPMGVWQPWQPDPPSSLLPGFASPIAIPAQPAPVSQPSLAAAGVAAIGIAIAAAVAAVQLWRCSKRGGKRGGGRSTSGWLHRATSCIERRLSSFPVPTNDEDRPDASIMRAEEEPSRPPQLGEGVGLTLAARAPCFRALGCRGMLLGALLALLAASLVASMLVFASIYLLSPMSTGLAPTAASQPHPAWPAATIVAVERGSPHIDRFGPSSDRPLTMASMSGSMSGSVSGPADATEAAGNSRLRNNIVLILTDDQDQNLGAGFRPGWDPPDAPTPMPRTRQLLGDAGVTASNFFAHTPICCPSRAELLTGRYMHNLALDETNDPLPAHDAAENCMHIDGRKVNSTHALGSSNLCPARHLFSTAALHTIVPALCRQRFGPRIPPRWRRPLVCARAPSCRLPHSSLRQVSQSLATEVHADGLRRLSWQRRRHLHISSFCGKGHELVPR